MMIKENIVAGTVMVTNDAEETYFLVNTENGTYSLPNVNLSESGKSPLGSIMEVVLLSTPNSFLIVKAGKGNTWAKAFIKLKDNIDKPLAAMIWTAC